MTLPSSSSNVTAFDRLIEDAVKESTPTLSNFSLENFMMMTREGRKRSGGLYFDRRA